MSFFKNVTVFALSAKDKDNQKEVEFWKKVNKDGNDAINQIFQDFCHKEILENAVRTGMFLDQAIDLDNLMFVASKKFNYIDLIIDIFEDSDDFEEMVEAYKVLEESSSDGENPMYFFLDVLESNDTPLDEEKIIDTIAEIF